MTKSYIVDIEKFRDDRGDIVIFENGVNLSFEVKRVYFIRAVPPDKSRGHHAHRKLKQVLIALNGSVSIDVSDHKGTDSYQLDSPDKGLYLHGLAWRVLRDFSSDCVLMVLASESFDADDYIDDHTIFLEESSK